jgi:hypothetical protein
MMSESLINLLHLHECMRGRIASFAMGAAIARRRTAMVMGENAQQAQRENEQLKEAQAQSTLHEQHPQSSIHDDITEKLQKYADLYQKGALTDGEFQKLKTDLLAKL